MSCRSAVLILLALMATLLPGQTAATDASFTDCPHCPEMVALKPGAFLMGASDEELEVANLPPHFDGREQPRHPVTISRAFAVAKYETSVAEYERFVAATDYDPAPGCWAFIGSEFIFEEDRSWKASKLGQDATHPVTCISWNDAVAYTSWLSEKTGFAYRLLTEAEWEYAARGGTDTPYWFGADAKDICRYVNLGDTTTRETYRWHEKKMKYASLSNWHNEPCTDGWAATAPVDFGEPNPFGLYNMLGNVQELVADCWQDNYRTGPYTEAPRLHGGDCNYRPMRGQGWSGIAASNRAAFRARMLTTDRRFYLGIRVARDLD